MGPINFVERHASPVSLIILAALMLVALTGALGGQPGERSLVQAPAAALKVDMARVLRSGMFFEMRIAVTARRPLQATTVAIEPSLWRDMTLNTELPDPEKQGFKNGQLRWSYGPLKPGESLLVKVDGQVNPPLFAGTQGDIVLLDGEQEIARQHLSIRVMP